MKNQLVKPLIILKKKREGCQVIISKTLKKEELTLVRIRPNHTNKLEVVQSNKKMKSLKLNLIKCLIPLTTLLDMIHITMENNLLNSHNSIKEMKRENPSRESKLKKDLALLTIKILILPWLLKVLMVTKLFDNQKLQPLNLLIKCLS